MTSLTADEVYWITLACLLETEMEKALGRERASIIHAACVEKAKAKARQAAA